MWLLSEEQAESSDIVSEGRVEDWPHVKISKDLTLPSAVHLWWKQPNLGRLIFAMQKTKKNKTEFHYIERENEPLVLKK